MNELAARSEQLPPTLFINHVQLESTTFPVTHGGFADIYRGIYEGNAVAVKRPRIYESDKKEFREVRVHV
jgi:hypothetical protein